MRQEPQYKDDLKTTENSCSSNDLPISKFLGKREPDNHCLIDFIYSKHQSKRLIVYLDEIHSILQKEAKNSVLKRLVSDIDFSQSNQKIEMKSKIENVQTFLKVSDKFGNKLNSIISRSSLVYLEQRDPYCEDHQKSIFSLNIRGVNLVSDLDKNHSDFVFSNRSSCENGMWDSIVGTFLEIISGSGLKLSYVKNDKNHYVFSMRQYFLTAGDHLPIQNEYFSFEIRYFNQDNKKELVSKYLNKLRDYNLNARKCGQKIKSWIVSHSQKGQWESRLNQIKKEQNFFKLSQVNPQDLNDGLVFTIKLNTGFGSSLVKDKMREILFKFLIDVSKFIPD